MTMRGVLVAMLIGALTPPCCAREWTDSTRKHTVEAEFVEFKDGKVHLKKQDGAIVAVALERLSEADQAFASAQADQSTRKKVALVSELQTPLGRCAGVVPSDERHVTLKVVSGVQSGPGGMQILYQDERRDAKAEERFLYVQMHAVKADGRQFDFEKCALRTAHAAFTPIGKTSRKRDPADPCTAYDRTRPTGARLFPPSRWSAEVVSQAGINKKATVLLPCNRTDSRWAAIDHELPSDLWATAASWTLIMNRKTLDTGL